jgi:hypothetical protein
MQGLRPRFLSQVARNDLRVLPQGQENIAAKKAPGSNQNAIASLPRLRDVIHAQAQGRVDMQRQVPAETVP